MELLEDKLSYIRDILEQHKLVDGTYDEFGIIVLIFVNLSLTHHIIKNLPYYINEFYKRWE